MSQTAAIIVAAAISAIGKKYQWGAAGPDSFDCSGLVEWSYNQADITVPRTSQAQAVGGQPIERDQLQPADIIIYYPDASHVALYVGNGNVVTASMPGVPVAQVPIDAAGPYTTARRYLNGEPTVTTPNVVATGVDYSGGIPGGAALASAGYTFACRYVFDGSPDLPYKLLTAAEADDLWANGVDPVSNWESTGTDALSGYSQGVTDAQQANTNHVAAGGPTDRPIYFSLDWDESQTQDTEVDAYFQGVASVIGLDRTGVYGGYWICSRLLAAGLVAWTWQTEAWSSDPGDLPPDGFDGDYLVSGCNLLQRNALGYSDVNGVECDIDVALTADYGQWHYSQGEVVTQPSEDDDILATVQDNQTQLRGPGLAGWPQLNGHTLVDALAAIGQKLGIPGFAPPA